MNWFKSFLKGFTEPLPREGQGRSECASNFTPRAQQVLSLARREADRFHHNFVGTEHLLLGLIRLGQGTAVTVLGNMGLNLESVRAEVERQVGIGPDQKIIGSIPYTPRVKKVLALAAKEAHALRHTYVGTEHILLGLLQEGDGVAARVLKNFNVDVEQTRMEILRELDPNAAHPAEGEGANISENLQGPGSLKPQLDSVDTSKRYDVYCWEGDRRVMVFRNALFKGRRKLLSTREHDFGGEYLELEQSNGHTVYLSLHSVLRFCEHGAEMAGEILPPQ